MVFGDSVRAEAYSVPAFSKRASKGSATAEAAGMLRSGASGTHIMLRLPKQFLHWSLRLSKLPSQSGKPQPQMTTVWIFEKSASGSWRTVPSESCTIFIFMRGMVRSRTALRCEGMP